MKENILVVDDERGQAEILKAILEREGYNISLAYDGKGALAAFLRSSPSLVLTDLKMPDMSGLELMDLILELSRNPIIIMTAHGTIDSAVEA
jgi:DNA-binding NtrC family response regulator